MKKTIITCLALLCLTLVTKAQEIVSPDGKLKAVLKLTDGGKPAYRVLWQGQEVIGSSALGMVTDMGDYTQGLELKEVKQQKVSETYALPNIKQSQVAYEATEAVATYTQQGNSVMDITLRVSNRDVAFRYKVYPQKDKRVCRVEREATSFVLPDGTTTFLCPQAKPMNGFARTSPSYETNYTLDEPTGKNGWGEGYTFPCLFKAHPQPLPKGGELESQSHPRKAESQSHPQKAESQSHPQKVTKKTPLPLGGAGGGLFLLISETGTDGGYVGCRLLCDGGNTYRIGFPQQGEMNGIGSVTPALSLPASTPWRTITVGPLANIVETTVPWDLVQPKYKASQEYTYGKGSWSWIIGMDSSCNFDEQKRYIDFSAAMGWQSVLIDALWDQQIGYDRMAELARYGREKGVGLFLWYNSNGSWNDAPQTPIGKMSDSRTRRDEMRWMQQCGIRGIKVDFFGGDKQPMMQLYEDILTDANDFGLMVIFHGCTLPRGWERMYPNYVASEAVLASENMHFGQGSCDAEARNACIHPFIRNTVGSMDFGGSTLNKYYSADNQHGTQRRTSDVFALATAVLFQSSVQHFAMAPNNLTDAPAWAVDFMKQVPTTWDETRFIDGYPGRYVILARRSGSKWFVVGINAESQPIKKTISLPMFSPGARLQVYSDDAQLNGSVKTVKQNKKQQVAFSIPQNGGVVITI